MPRCSVPLEISAKSETKETAEAVTYSFFVAPVMFEEDMTEFFR
jgi:hypothetical protein